jgi:AraC-like DNA-binding protein
MMEHPYPKLYFYKRLVLAKLFIDSHYAEPIDLDNIADEAFFSKFHFIREFKKIYQNTPHQYLIYLRIEKSKELLQAAMPVTDACYEVGFESVSSFSRLFRRMTGLTPSAYSARQQIRKEKIAALPLAFIPACFSEKQGWLEK